MRAGAARRPAAAPHRCQGASAQRHAGGIEIANRANGAVEAVDREYFGVLGDDRPQFTPMLARLPR